MLVTRRRPTAKAAVVCLGRKTEFVPAKTRRLFAHFASCDGGMRARIADTKHLSGPMEIGEDLMRFKIGERVVAKKWHPELRKYLD